MRKHLLVPLLPVALFLMASIVRGVQQAMLTTGGPTQDFQHSAFSVDQPVKAGLFFMAPSTAVGTNLDHARMSVGFTDGTNHRCVSIRARDAQAAASSTVKQAFTDKLAWIYSASGTGALASMSFSSMGNDRIVGTYNTLPSAAWLINALLFGGSDCQAFVGEFSLNASSGGTTVVDSTSHPGFDFGWDLIFFVSRVGAFNGTSSDHAAISFGIAVWDGSSISQGSVSWSNQDGVGTEAAGADLSDQRCIHGHLMPPADGDKGEITARNGSGGFTVTTRGANGSAFATGFLALRLGGIQGIKLFSRDTLTATGSDSWTDSGHAPQLLMSLSSSATALNTFSSGAGDACLGIGAACGDSGSHEEFSSAIMADDGAATSNTKSVTNSVFHHVPDELGANPTTADLTSIQPSGATLNYSAVLGTARKQLILSVGRAKVFGTAYGTGGSAAHGMATVPSFAAASGYSVGGEVSRVAATVVRSARARSADFGGARAAPVISKRASARSSGGFAERSVAASAKGCRSRAAEGSAELASGQASHGSKASSHAGAPERAAGKASHAAQAATANGTVESALGAVAKGIRVRSAAAGAARAAGKVTHGAHARAHGCSAVRVVGKVSHAGRGRDASGAADSAQAMVAAAGQTASGFSVVGAVGRASGRVGHAGRASPADGSAARAAGKVSHQARSADALGEVAKPAGKKTARSRAFSADGMAEKVPAMKSPAARARAAASGGEMARGEAVHGARAAGHAGAEDQAIGQSRHAARARGASGADGTVILRPAEVLGFYARTAKAVRGRLLAAASGLAIQHENLRFTEPTGTWARASIDFDEITDVEYGGGKVSYLVPGTLEVEIRTRLREGKKALLEQAEALAAELQLRELSGVVYSTAVLKSAKDAGDDEFAAKLLIPFRSWDASYPRAVGALPDSDDYPAAERAVRARFASELADIAVSYDNLPPTTGATWVRLMVNEQDGFDAGGVRRTVGVMEALIHTPALTGTKASLRLADRVVEAFRTVDVGGVVFDIPYLQRGRQVAGEWVLPVFCPWSCDHVTT